MTTEPPANPPEDLASLLLTVTMLLTRRLTARMRHSDQHLEPAHAGLLMRMSEGPCKMSDLAQHQCVQLPTVSRSVSVLVDRGLVERWIPEDNRRTTMVRLSRRGRNVLNSLIQDARTHTEALLQDLRETDREPVRKALALLSETLGQSVPGEDSAAALRRANARPAARA